MNFHTVNSIWLLVFLAGRPQLYLGLTNDHFHTTSIYYNRYHLNLDKVFLLFTGEIQCTLLYPNK